MDQNQYCTFHLGDLFLGIEVRRVQEVLRGQRMTRVPLASPVVRGLINLRGQIVTAIDLRRRIGLPDRAPEHEPMNVVLRDEEGITSFLVDAIGDVLEVDEAEVEAPPTTLRGAARELIRGVHKQQGQLLLLLDVDRAVRVGDEDLEAADALPAGRGSRG